MYFFIIFCYLGNVVYLVFYIGFEEIENCIVFDSLEYKNNVIFSLEVCFFVIEFKCGFVLSMCGGCLVFIYFNSCLWEVIIIILWFKLDLVLGIVILFRMMGFGVKYNLQYCEGNIYWFYVDDLGYVIFSMVMRQIVDLLDWVYFSVIYDVYINRSKIILNGVVLDEKEGYGLLL